MCPVLGCQQPCGRDGPRVAAPLPYDFSLGGTLPERTVGACLNRLQVLKTLSRFHSAIIFKNISCQNREVKNAFYCDFILNWP